MPRAPVAAAPAPAPVQPQMEASVYEELWDAVYTANPQFKPPQNDETDQNFFRRVATALSALPDPAFGALSKEAQDWYNAAADIISPENGSGDTGADIDPPDGYEGEEDGASNGAVAAPQPAAPAAPAPRAPAPRAPAPPVAAAAPAAGGGRKGNTAGLEAYRARIKAEKAAAAGQAPAAPAAAPGRRAAAPAPVAAPAAPGRRAAPQPVAAPAPAAPGRRSMAPVAAPVQAAPARQRQATTSGVSMMELIRQFIIHNYDLNPRVTKDQVVEYLASEGVKCEPTTASGTLSATYSVLDLAAQMGWTPPAG